LTTPEDEPHARNEINNVLKELELKPFDEQGLNKQCNEINNREKLRFNFAEQNIKEIQEKFSKFF
jgi:hypothetical protein